MTVLALVVFQMFLCFFLVTHSVIDRCQIVTDTFKNNVSKFVWKPFKLLLWKWKCFAEASLLNLHHLYSLYSPFTGSKTVQFMEDLAVFTALNHLGSFGKNCVKFQKNKYVIYRLRVGPHGEKLWPQSWKCCPQPMALGSIFKTSITVFHHTDLPACK